VRNLIKETGYLPVSALKIGLTLFLKALSVRFVFPFPRCKIAAGATHARMAAA
jgi:hypothetical protein